MSKGNIINLSPARFDLRLKPLRLLPESSIQSMCRSLKAQMYLLNKNDVAYKPGWCGADSPHGIHSTLFQPVALYAFFP